MLQVVFCPMLEFASEIKYNWMKKAEHWTKGTPMRLFDYSRLYDKAWNTDILNLVVKIHECKGTVDKRKQANDFCFFEIG